jgi:putative hydrolase of the HAD superfamily
VLSFDLDGTLFRKGTDDVFWNEKIPALLAERKKISFREAQRFVLEEYKKVGQGDARWYIPEYWFNLFNLDTPPHTVLSTMNYASGVYDDIDAIREFAKNYMIIISTNNPRSILEHKLKALGCTDHILETFSSVSDFNNMQEAWC